MKSSIYSLHPWQEGVALPLLKTTTSSTYSDQKTKESLKATIAAVLHADSRLYMQLGQFALLVDICAWRMAAHMSLTGRKEGRQVPVLQWKTPADTILVPVAHFVFALILVSESPAKRGRVTSALINWLQEMKAHRTMK